MNIKHIASLILFLFVAVVIYGAWQYVAHGGVTFGVSGLNETNVATTIRANPDLNDGLVGHWTFDGGDMLENAADISGRGNHGMLEGFTSTTTAPGPLGQALEFDGVDDWVNVADTAEHNFGSATSFSAFLWVKTEVNGTTFAKYDSGKTPGWLISHNDAGKLYAFVRDGDGSGTNELVIAGSITNIADGEWHHVGFVVDRNAQTLTTYINGEQDDQESIANIDSVSNAEPVTIGRYGGGDHHEGPLDDARIYNRALSATEIKRLYQIGATTRVGVTIDSPERSDGLIGHWTFDGGDVDWAADTVLDRSGGGNHGSTTNMTAAAAATPGVLGQGLLFTTGTDRVEVPNDTENLSFSSPPFSYGAWFYPKGHGAGPNGGRGAIISKRVESESTYNYGVRILDGSDQLTTYGCSGLGSTPVIPHFLDHWHHVMVVVESSTAGKIYVDGELVTESVIDCATLAADTTVLTIGAITGSTYTWDGMIDDVRIYNRALTAEEVERLYDMGR